MKTLELSAAEHRTAPDHLPEPCSPAAAPAPVPAPSVTATATALPAALLEWCYFQKAHKKVVEHVDDDLRKVQALTLTEIEILLYVQKASGRIRFIDLAKLTMLSQSRISRQMDSLERQGFLRRETDALDRRATYALITTAGEQALSGTLPHFTRSIDAHFTSLIPRDSLQAFSQVLQLLLRNPSYAATTRDIIDAARVSTSRWPSGDMAD